MLAGCTNVFLQPDRALHDRPERVGAKWEEVRFKSSDGTGLTGMWFPAQNVRVPKGVIVHFHGNGGNMTGHFLYVYWLALEGYDVFTFDYRGYGASDGEKSVKGSVEDGAAAIGAARKRAGGAAGRLIVLGQSMGGALALASLDRDGGEGVRGVVLDSTFASYRAVARDKLRQVWVTWPLQYPLSWTLISERFAPALLIARRKAVPLLMLHATGDPVVPYAQGRRLFDLAPGPKEFWKLDSAGHTEAFFAQGPKYRPPFLAWLDRVLQ